MILFCKNFINTIIKQVYTFSCYFVLLCLLSGCVSHRKKGETSGVGRIYHNTTAKYNGYFNANEIMQETMLSLEQAYKFNYNKTLPVFTYSAIESVDAEKPKLDKAIEKVSTVVMLHRVSHWTDDCYLVLCKAQYLKKDYETAENSFRFFLDEFDPLKLSLKSKVHKEKTAKQKKKEAEELKKERKKESERKAKERKRLQKEKAEAKKKGKSIKTQIKEADKVEPPKSEVVVAAPLKEQHAKPLNEGSWLFPHYTNYWEGSIWAGKNLIERGKHFEAEQLFRRVENEPTAPEKIKGELYASYADLYLKSGKEEKAIPNLKLAIQHTKSKKLKARYAYIIGQLYQKSGRVESSNQFFKQCLDFKPSYELAFHARMNILINEASQGSPDQIAKNIESLLDDPKNRDYQGELYYALGVISIKQERKKQAIEQFNQSLQSVNVSNSQKADSYYQLAEIFITEQDYLKAKLYFDSTLSMLVKNDERRGPITKTVANLGEIASHLQNIALQDSLLRIAALSVKDKRSLAIQLKNAKKAKIAEPSTGRDIRSRFSELEAVSMNPFDREIEKKSDSKKAASSFFAYDQRSVNRGRSEFEQIWGQVILEDNWRRKNKNTFTVREIKIEQEEIDQDTLESDLAQYLAGIPETPAEIEEAKKKIANSMYMLGVLYREKLENYSKSNQSFKDLLAQYPNTEKKVDALYYLYMNCLELHDDGCANSYKDKITYEFSGSHYAKLLTDPEYVKSLLSKRDEISSDYNKAYQLYSSNRYSEAFEILQAIKNKIKAPHLLQARVALLSAFCLGNIQGKDVYINALKEVIANYPSSPEEIKAKEILRFLKGDQDAFVEISQAELDKTNFKEEDDKMHFVLIVMFDPPEKTVDKAKIAISDYNLNYHKTENLKMTSLELDTEINQPLILIRKFDNKQMAMKYYQGIQRKSKEFITEFDNWEVYVVTQNNYREILRIKTLSEYKAFFKKHYLDSN